MKTRKTFGWLMLAACLFAMSNVQVFAEDVAGKNIDVKDITVTSGEIFHIFKDKGVILRSSVLVEEGGELIIFERLE